MLGANGSGKSSFLRLLAGEQVPHEGVARLGGIRPRPGSGQRPEGREHAAAIAGTQTAVLTA